MDETNSRTAFCCEISLLCSLLSTVYIGSVQSSEAAFYGAQAAARRWKCTILSILRKTFASAAKCIAYDWVTVESPCISHPFFLILYLRQPWMNQSQSMPSLWPTNYPAFLTSHCSPSPLVFFACLPSFSILFANSIFNKNTILPTSTPYFSQTQRLTYPKLNASLLPNSTPHFSQPQRLTSPKLNASLLPNSTPHFSPLPPPIFTSLLFLSTPYSSRFHPLPLHLIPIPYPLPAPRSPLSLYEVHPKSKWKMWIKREWLQLGG